MAAFQFNCFLDILAPMSLFVNPTMYHVYNEKADYQQNEQYMKQNVSSTDNNSKYLTY